MGLRRGTSAGMSFVRRSRPKAVTASPAAPPRTARSKLSVNNWRNTRARPAPNAARTANSVSRLRARQLKIRDIGGGNQQHKGDGAQQQAERAAQFLRAEHFAQVAALELVFGA